MATEHIPTPTEDSSDRQKKGDREGSIYGKGRNGLHIEVKPVSFAAAPLENVSTPAFLSKPAEVAEPVTWWPGHSQPSARAAFNQQPKEEPLSEELVAQIEAAREIATKEGFDAGHQEGLDAAKSEIETKLSEELGALQETRNVLEQKLKELVMLRSQLLEQAESDALDLIFSVSKRLAGEAQLHDTSWVAPLVKQASQALTDSDELICKVSPVLAERLGGADAFELSHGATLVVDPDLEPLDLIVETKTGRVDASFEERLDNLMRAVTADLDAQAREGGPS